MNASETEYKMNPQNCAKHDRGTCTCAFLYIAPHFNSRKLFHLIQKGIVAIMGLKTAQTNPWIADGWFKEFRRGFNLWGEVKEETIEFRKRLGFLVGDWTLGLAADCHLGRAGISSGYPQGCDHESLVTKHISSHWCTPGNIALSFCRCDSSPQWAHQFLLLGWETLLIILLVLSVQGTPTYPPHRFHHWHFAEFASSQTFPSLHHFQTFYFNWCPYCYSKHLPRIKTPHILHDFHKIDSKLLHKRIGSFIWFMTSHVSFLRFTLFYTLTHWNQDSIL